MHFQSQIWIFLNYINRTLATYSYSEEHVKRLMGSEKLNINEYTYMRSLGTQLENERLVWIRFTESLLQ